MIRNFGGRNQKFREQNHQQGERGSRQWPARLSLMEGQIHMQYRRLLILGLCGALAAAPLPALAADAPQGSTQAQAIAAQDLEQLEEDVTASTKESGTCGKNLTWKLEDGTLTISGKGAMTDWEEQSSPFVLRKDITRVVIGGDVTSIGDWAFQGCTALREISLPGSLIKIGNHTFHACTALQTITLPESVSRLGNGAFTGCTSLTQADLSASSLKELGASTFMNCSALTRVTLPDTLEEIGDHAFDGAAALTSITLPGKLQKIGSKAFGVYNWDDKGNELSLNTMPIRQVAFRGSEDDWDSVSGTGYLLGTGVSVTFDDAADTEADEKTEREDTASLSAFKDMKNAPAWQKTAVGWGIAQGLTSGTSKTTFSPGAACTRGQLITFLWRAAGSPGAQTTTEFADVTGSSSFYDAVQWAAQNKIIAPDSKKNFSPDKPCSRAMALAFLYRAEKSPDYRAKKTFTDLHADWQKDPVLWAVANGITSGTGKKTFSPDAPCTRAAAMTFLYRDSQLSDSVLFH